jgi:hypothetical protein
MTKNPYDTQDLRSYLLGSASVDDVESMDELSITDAEFAGLLSVVEKDLVDNYVQGELGGEEVRRFEGYYLASPLRREKVRFARSFQEYSRAHVPDASLTSGSEAGWKKRGIAGFFRSLGIFRGAQPAFRLAISAATLIVVGLGCWLVIRNWTGSQSDNEIVSNIDENRTDSGIKLPQVRPSPGPGNIEIPTNQDQTTKPSPQPPVTPKPRVTQPEKPLIASIVLPPPLRGSQPRTLSVPVGTDNVRMRLELESDDFRSYAVELKEGSTARTIWRSGRVHASGPSARSLNIMIPAKPLRPAVYTLTVSGIPTPGQPPEIVGDYPFRVVP